jgi:2-keto-3-deoxy-L-rhamnonate aldolase RhmA
MIPGGPTGKDGWLDFRRRLLDREPLAGSFIKTPTVHATEILANLGYDFVVIDQEHGPFDRGTLDVMLCVARATGIAGIVRVPDEAAILAALDMGASGIIVPHVNSASAAKSAAAAARYTGGARGCSPSPRAGRYGALSLADHVAQSDSAVSVTVMIEHPDAVRDVNAIAAVEGIDALFLGLGDLSVAMGTPSASVEMLRPSAERVRDAAIRHGKALMATAASIDAGAWLLNLGVTAMVVSSDQGLFRSAASRQLENFRARESAERQA